MSKQISVKVEGRSPGRKNSKEIRKSNLVPIVVYGNGHENKFGAIADLAFRKNVVAHENALFSLEINGEKVSALMRDYDYNSLKNKFTHADFQEVAMGVEIEAQVNLIFVGEPKGVKAGGILIKSIETLDITCLPKDIPDDIEVDISALEIDDRLTVADLKLPPNIKVIDKQDDLVISVNEPSIEAEPEVAAAPAAAATPAAAAAPAGEKKPEKK